MIPESQNHNIISKHDLRKKQRKIVLIYLLFRRFSSATEPSRWSDIRYTLLVQIRTERTEGIIQLIYEWSFHRFKIQTMLLISPFCSHTLFPRRILQHVLKTPLYNWTLQNYKHICNVLIIFFVNPQLRKLIYKTCNISTMKHDHEKNRQNCEPNFISKTLQSKFIPIMG